MSETKETSLWLVPIITLGFASTQLTWSLFNIAVPVILDETFGISLGLIGFIMTWDNIIAFFVQPTIGSYSDRMITRWGRRFPFIIPGIIFGSILFFLLSQSKNQMLYLFLINIVIFNLFMALYRSPSVSLVPDLIPSHKRSIANGLANLTGGIAAALSLFIAGGLLKAGHTTEAFGFVSIGMIVCLVLLLIFVREPKYEVIESDEPSEGAISRLKSEMNRIVHDDNKSMLFMLLALLSWFMAWNAIEAFYSVFVNKEFLPNLDAEKAAGEAGQVLFVFPVVFVIFTIVGGILGTKIGRRLTMKIGLLLMLFSIILGAFVYENSFLGLEMNWKTSYRLIFVFAGIGWGLVNVNSIVVVWEHSSDNGIGTGIYYAFSSAAAILGPTLVGILMDITTVRALFPFSIVFLTISFFLLLNVKTGEQGERETILGDALSEMID